MPASRNQPPEPLYAFDSLSSLLAPELRQLDQLAARYREASASGRVLPNTLKALRVELTYHSNAIEGSTLSLRETQLIIEGKSPAGERDLREIYEARNHDRALRLIEQWATRGIIEPTTERDLLEVHAKVLADINDDFASRYRSDRVRIVGTGFVPAGSQKIDLLIPAALELAHRPGIHPLLAAAEVHYNLVAIHPFVDGNGRTSRLMMNFQLLRHAYPYVVVEVITRGRYLAALDEANHGRCEPFARFILEAAITTAKKLLMEEP